MNPDELSPLGDMPEQKKYKDVFPVSEQASGAPASPAQPPVSYAQELANAWSGPRDGEGNPVVGERTPQGASVAEGGAPQKATTAEGTYQAAQTGLTKATEDEAKSAAGAPVAKPSLRKTDEEKLRANANTQEDIRLQRELDNRLRLKQMELDANRQLKNEDRMFDLAREERSYQRQRRDKIEDREYRFAEWKAQYEIHKADELIKQLIKRQAKSYTFAGGKQISSSLENVDKVSKLLSNPEKLDDWLSARMATRTLDFSTPLKALSERGLGFTTAGGPLKLPSFGANKQETVGGTTADTHGVVSVKASGASTGGDKDYWGARKRGDVFLRGY